MPSSCDINVMRRDYGTMNSQRARELRKRYGADYLLVNHTFQTGDISELEVVFRNGPWAVYRIN
jgi:bisphosphoglycerate-dependent phosphoglycerate mutase